MRWIDLDMKGERVEEILWNYMLCDSDLMRRGLGGDEAVE